MGRLIDADKIKEKLSESTIFTRTSAFLCILVDKQPTAFDLDKVLEQLENEAFWSQSTFDEDGFSNDDSEEIICLDDAIEIVKTGGL